MSGFRLYEDARLDEVESLPAPVDKIRDHVCGVVAFPRHSNHNGKGAAGLKRSLIEGRVICACLTQAEHHLSEV